MRLEKVDNKYFLVRSASFKDRHNKVRQYLGTTEPDLEKAIKDYAYDLELKAADKVAEMACAYYTSLIDIKEIEKLRYLHNIYIKSLNKTELEVYTEQCETLYIHGTTAIEGNTLTLQETYYLLSEGIVPRKSLREINEVQNYKKVRILSQKHQGKINLIFIRKLHSLIMDNIDYNAGIFRKADNIVISGCDLSVGLAATIELDLQDLINTFYDVIKTNNPFEQVILFHYVFEKIHPFTDGNGRVGREILNYLLKKEGYPMLVIPKESREAYISALELGDKGQFAEMIRIFADLMLAYYKKELDDVKNVVVPTKNKIIIDGI